MPVRLMIAAVAAGLWSLTTPAVAAEKEDARKGTVTGVVTAKGPAWIEVKADGEEKARRYVPHWRGGLPKDGGGPDKKIVEAIKNTPEKSRVRLEWTFEERPRVEKIEVLKKAD